MVVQLGNDCRIIVVVGYHSHALKVFRRRAHHRRAADVDIFDQLVRGHAGCGGRGRKRIEIHDDQIDGLDFIFGNLGTIVRLAALKKNPAVHFGVQCFHPAAEHFRPSGQFGHVANFHTGLAQQFRRPAGGNNFNREGSELPRKIHNASFVVNTD